MHARRQGAAFYRRAHGKGASSLRHEGMVAQEGDLEARFVGTKPGGGATDEGTGTSQGAWRRGDGVAEGGSGRVPQPALARWPLGASAAGPRGAVSARGSVVLVRWCQVLFCQC
jgi:hypothetical protein